MFDLELYKPHILWNGFNKHASKNNNFPMQKSHKKM